MNNKIAPRFLFFTYLKNKAYLSVRVKGQFCQKYVRPC